MTTGYQLGWSDGYAEGYACKLADATEPFIPTLQVKPEEVLAVAKWLRTKYSAMFPADDDAIGMARGMLRVASESRGDQP